MKFRGCSVAIVSFDRKLLFVHIPKCGGTSIENEWRKHALASDLVVAAPEGPNAPGGTNRYHITHHSTFEFMRGAIGDEVLQDFVTCVLVREPLKIVASYYTYGRALLGTRIHRLINRVGLPEAFAAQHAVREATDRNTEAYPAFVFTGNRGATRDAMLSTGFDDYLDRVGDERWTDYMRRYTRAGGRDVAVGNVLKLEDPVAVRKFFKTRLSRAFDLQHANRTGTEPPVWSAERRKRYLDLTEQEYLTFEYEPS